DAFEPPAPEPDRDSLPPVLRGEWNSNPAFGVHDILFWIQKDNPRNGQPGDPGDSQFSRWDYPVQLWAAAGGVPVVLPNTQQPTASGPITTSAFTITEPATGTYVRYGYSFTVSVRFPSTVQVNSVSYYLNGVLVGTATGMPFSAQISPRDRGPAVLRAVAN